MGQQRSSSAARAIFPVNCTSPSSSSAAAMPFLSDVSPVTRVLSFSTARFSVLARVSRLPEPVDHRGYRPTLRCCPRNQQSHSAESHRLPSFGRTHLARAKCHPKKTGKECTTHVCHTHSVSLSLSSPSLSRHLLVGAESRLTATRSTRPFNARRLSNDTPSTTTTTASRPTLVRSRQFS